MIVIITHIFHFKFIPNFVARRIIFIAYVTISCFTIITSCFRTVKIFFIRQFFFIKYFKTVHVFIRISSFCFKSSKFLEPHSTVKYLKSLFEIKIFEIFEIKVCKLIQKPLKSRNITGTFLVK